MGNFYQFCQDSRVKFLYSSLLYNCLGKLNQRHKGPTRFSPHSRDLTVNLVVPPPSPPPASPSRLENKAHSTKPGSRQSRTRDLCCVEHYQMSVMPGGGRGERTFSPLCYARDCYVYELPSHVCVRGNVQSSSSEWWAPCSDCKLALWPASIFVRGVTVFYRCAFVIPRYTLLLPCTKCLTTHLGGKYLEYTSV